MAGRMGGVRTTVKNLEVVEVDAERNLLLIRGGVPGVRKGYVYIEKLQEPAEPPVKPSDAAEPAEAEPAEAGASTAEPPAEAEKPVEAGESADPGPSAEAEAEQPSQGE